MDDVRDLAEDIIEARFRCRENRTIIAALYGMYCQLHETAPGVLTLEQWELIEQGVPGVPEADIMAFVSHYHADGSGGATRVSRSPGTGLLSVSPIALYLLETYGMDRLWTQRKSLLVIPAIRPVVVSEKNRGKTIVWLQMVALSMESSRIEYGTRETYCGAITRLTTALRDSGATTYERIRNHRKKYPDKSFDAAISVIINTQPVTMLADVVHRNTIYADCVALTICARYVTATANIRCEILSDIHAVGEWCPPNSINYTDQGVYFNVDDRLFEVTGRHSADLVYCFMSELSSAYPGNAIVQSAWGQMQYVPAVDDVSEWVM